MREKIFKYVKEKYKTEQDYPFSIAPGYPVLRHKDNRKWFALIMDIPDDWDQEDNIDIYPHI